MSDDHILLTDTLELVNYTLTNKFVESWRHKFSEHLIKEFQKALLGCFDRQKPIKVKSLTLQLKKNNKFSTEEITEFYNSIQIDLYRPIIYGPIK